MDKSITRNEINHMKEAIWGTPFNVAVILIDLLIEHEVIPPISDEKKKKISDELYEIARKPIFD